MDKETYRIQAEYCKALSHPTRIKILSYLERGERCVCEIVPFLEDEQSNVSRHLAVLRRAGILSRRKEGVSVYYRVKDEKVFEILALVLESLQNVATQTYASFT